MLKMIQTTRMLIQPCDDNKYSGQTQAHIYSQILGLGLELEIEINIRDGSGNSVYARLIVHSHFLIEVRGGFEPVSYYMYTSGGKYSKY